LRPGGDGRTYACEYCEVLQQVSIDAEQIAAGLRADLADAAGFLHRLATSLHHAFGDRTRVRHEAGQVVHFEIDLDKDRFVALRESDGVVAQHKKMVRGVALKTSTHAIDVWIAMLAEALATHATTRAQAARVMSQIKLA
jgi:hypothetical protein